MVTGGNSTMLNSKSEEYRLAPHNNNANPPYNNKARNEKGGESGGI